jgi:hypothetical protein
VLEATINGPSGSAPGVRLVHGLTAAKEVTTSRAVPPPIFTPYGVARGDIRTGPKIGPFMGARQRPAASRAAGLR